ncbi:hypothetical protein VF06_34315 [Nostoc linckia z4]|nr:hypothetical protein VF06_34315 [Nostoc linckia z4]
MIGNSGVFLIWKFIKQNTRVIMRNIDAEQLAAGYRKGRIRAASRQRRTQRKKENLAQPHKEMV